MSEDTGIVQQVESLKLERQKLLERIKVLSDAHSLALDNARKVVCMLNEEQGHKNFKDSDRSKPFGERLSTAIKSMKNEVRKIEISMDVHTTTDDDLDQNLKMLEDKEAKLEALKYEQKVKYTDTKLYSEVMSVVQSNAAAAAAKVAEEAAAMSRLRTASHSLGSVDELMGMNREAASSLNSVASTMGGSGSGGGGIGLASTTFGTAGAVSTLSTRPLPSSQARFDDPFAMLIAAKEKEMAERKRQLESSLADSLQESVANLDKLSTVMHKQITAERVTYHNHQDNMYGALLEGFLRDTQATSRRFGSNYGDVLDEARSKKRLSSSAGAPSGGGSGASQSLDAKSAAGSGLKSPTPALTADGALVPVEAASHCLTPAQEEEVLPWRMMVSRRFEELLENDRKCRELEAEMDALLIHEMDAAQVDVDSGLADDLLGAIMDNLTGLYIQSCEIDLQYDRAKSGSAHSHKGSPYYSSSSGSSSHAGGAAGTSDAGGTSGAGSHH